MKKYARIRAIVSRMATAGITQELAAKIIGVSEATLKSRLGDEFKEGMIDYDQAVARNLRRHALGEGPGAVTAAIYWTKVRLGWSERQRIEHSFEAGTIQKLVEGFVDIIHRAIPDFCPGCNTALALKPKIAQLLIEESAKLSGATAVAAAAATSPAPQEAPSA